MSDSNRCYIDITVRYFTMLTLYSLSLQGGADFMCYAAKNLICMSLWPEYGCSFFGLQLVRFAM